MKNLLDSSLYYVIITGVVCLFLSLIEKEVNMSAGMNESSKQPDTLKDSRSGPKYNESESTGNALLKFAGTWEGDDLEQCLKEVYKTRGETTF
jgi:hypothetical protein